MIDLVITHLTHPWGPPWTLETLGDHWRTLATCLKITILGERSDSLWRFACGDDLIPSTMCDCEKIWYFMKRSSQLFEPPDPYMGAVRHNLLGLGLCRCKSAYVFVFIFVFVLSDPNLVLFSRTTGSIHTCDKLSPLDQKKSSKYQMKKWPNQFGTK